MKRLTWLGIAAVGLGAIALVLVRPGTSHAPGESTSWTPFYRLQVKPGEVNSAPGMVARAISAQISATFAFEDGYPREGRVEMVDSGEGPGVMRTTCVPTAGVGERRGCLQLDSEGDLVEIDLWDQPNELFFPFVVYLLEPGARLDMGETPRVTVRLYSDPNRRSLLLLHQSVEMALQDLGAAPFSWQ